MPFVGNVAKGYREYFVDWMVNCRRMAVHDPRRRYVVVRKRIRIWIDAFRAWKPEQWDANRENVSFLRFWRRYCYIFIFLSPFHDLIHSMLVANKSHIQLYRLIIPANVSQIYQTAFEALIIPSYLENVKGKRERKKTLHQLFPSIIWLENKIHYNIGSRYETKETTFHRSTQFPLLIKS